MCLAIIRAFIGDVLSFVLPWRNEITNKQNKTTAKKRDVEVGWRLAYANEEENKEQTKAPYAALTAVASPCAVNRHCCPPVEADALAAGHLGCQTMPH